MSIIETVKNIQKFNQDPDSYILQVTNNEHKYDNYEIHVMKKGIWTWLKIHVGGKIGLFDPTSVKLSNIALFFAKRQNFVIDRVDSLEESKQFETNFNAKMKKWEDKHFKVVLSPIERETQDQKLFNIATSKSPGYQLTDPFSNSFLGFSDSQSFRAIDVRKVKDGFEFPLYLSGLHNSDVQLTDVQKKQAVDQEALLDYLRVGGKSHKGEIELQKAKVQGYKQITIKLTPVEETSDRVKIQIRLGDIR